MYNTLYIAKKIHCTTKLKDLVFISFLKVEAIPTYILPTVFVKEKSEIPKLSLETLTEVAASVTKRDEGSPEYIEVAKPQAFSEARDANIPVRPQTTVSYLYFFKDFQQKHYSKYSTFLVS